MRVPQIVRTESIRRQRTLARPVEVAGFGFWSSQDVVYSFQPAPEDYGVVFVRSDLPDSPPIPATVVHRIHKPRQTSLAVGEAQVDMVEHVLAALKGARIDNCKIVVSAAEAPGIDGSAAAFVDALLEAGAEEQAREKIRLKIVSEGEFTDESKPNGGRIAITPSERGETHARTDSEPKGALQLFSAARGLSKRDSALPNVPHL